MVETCPYGQHLWHPLLQPRKCLSVPVLCEVCGLEGEIINGEIMEKVQYENPFLNQ